MTVYRYETKLIAVRAVDYSDAAAIALQDGLTALAGASDPGVRFRRSGQLIDRDTWHQYQEGDVPTATPAQPNPLRAFIVEQANLRAREVEWLKDGQWEPLSVFKDAAGTVELAIESTYCVPPWPSRYYPSLMLFNSGDNVTLENAAGDPLGKLAIMLDLAPAEHWEDASK